MKKTHLFLGIVLLLTAGICAAGCVATDPLAGTWEAGTDSGLLGTVWQFNNDGTGVLSIAVSGIGGSVDFTWKKISDGEYTITCKNEAISKLQSIIPESGKLKVTFADGQKTAVINGVTYTRKA